MKFGDIDDFIGVFICRVMFWVVLKLMSFKVVFCLVFIDFDYFKWINDRFGYVVGDEVLFIFGRVICECICKMDIFCWYGGEEFLFCLYDINEDNVVMLFKDIKCFMELYIYW